MTMYRMRQREFILGLTAATLDLRRSLLDLAVKHRHTIFAVHTHTQRAQPTTVAHYLLAVVEQLERDTARLKAGVPSNESESTGVVRHYRDRIRIDRSLTSDLLGFNGPTRKYLRQYRHGGLTCSKPPPRPLSCWSASGDSCRTSCCGHPRNSTTCGSQTDSCSASSIMPQKRNPVAFEHARAIGSKGLGQAQAILMTVHNTPFGDIVDTEDDLQPLVFSMFRDATRTVKLLAAAMRAAEFDTVALEARAGDGWTTLTELADTLVRDHRMPFRTAHAIAGRLVAGRRQHPQKSLAELLSEATEGLLSLSPMYTESQLETIPKSPALSWT